MTQEKVINTLAGTLLASLLVLAITLVLCTAAGVIAITIREVPRILQT